MFVQLSKVSIIFQALSLFFLNPQRYNPFLFFLVIKDESKKDSAPKVIPMPGSDDDYDRCSQTLQV